MERCPCCFGSGRIFYFAHEAPLELPEDAAVLLDNGEVVALPDYLDPERPMHVDGLTAQIIAIELPCAECDSTGFSLENSSFR